VQILEALELHHQGQTPVGLHGVATAAGNHLSVGPPFAVSPSRGRAQAAGRAALHRSPFAKRRGADRARGYLLRWINSKEMRQEVTGETNKIESYHAFTKWLNFGGDVITENDPVEQQKRLRYIDLVASAVIPR